MTKENKPDMMKTLLLLNPKKKMKKKNRSRKRRNLFARAKRTIKRKTRRIRRFVAKSVARRKIRRRVKRNPLIGKIPRAAKKFRSSRRRSAGSSGGFLKSLASKDTLMLAGGIFSAGFLSQYVVNKFAAKIPQFAGAYTNTIISAAVPLGAAYLLRNKQPALAKGFLVGAIVNIAGPLLNNALGGILTPAATLPTSAYLGGNVSEYLGGALTNGRQAIQALPSYQANQVFQETPGMGVGAFPSSAFAN